jgi:hypothetical protein
MSSLSGFSSDQLLDELRSLVGRERIGEAELLACVGEVDARRLYLREGCSSMFRYCIEVLHFSEAAAFKRITAARAGRKFPEVLAALREGALHLTAVGVLAPHFTAENLEELIALGRHQTKGEIQRRLADRNRM